MLVQDIPQEFLLITDSQEVQAICEKIGVYTDIYKCLFVLCDSDYKKIYGLESSIPFNYLPVEELL